MNVWLQIAGIAVAFVYSQIFAQSAPFQTYDDAISEDRKLGNFRIGFYNLENLFDPKDDSLTVDEAFTPEGDNSYTFSRYKKKSIGLGKTLLALGAWQPVDIIGLCEVENRWVMEGLTKYTPLANAGYEIVHEDSPDRRGIDVACIYKPDRFNLIIYKYYRINFPDDANRKTRDLLYLKGMLTNQDTLHLFINHWPSRYGGQFSSEGSRAFVAKTLREKVDSLNAKYQNPLIVICGDFNDEPDDISLKDELHALLNPEEAKNNDLVNLMYPMKYKFGTHSYAGEWGVLDQFIISQELLQSSSTSTTLSSVGVFDAPWLLTTNAAGVAVPFRTFQGPAYKGGYSDHLPIFLDLQVNSKPSP